LEYNFILRHIPGTTNTRADTLLRRSNNEEAKEDNNNIIVLPNEVFANTTYTSLSEIDAQCQKEQIAHEDEIKVWVDHHNLHKHDQLWWKNDTLVVVGNNDLRRGVIQ